MRDIEQLPIAAIEEIAKMTRDIEKRQRENTVTIVRTEERVKSIHDDLADFKGQVRKDIGDLQHSIKEQEASILALQEFKTAKSAEIGVWKWIVGALGLSAIAGWLGFPAK